MIRMTTDPARRTLGRNRRWPWVLACLALISGALTVPAQEEESSTPVSSNESEFEIIWRKNIFNPNRAARQEQRRQVEPERRPEPTESFALLGTLGTSEGWIAFFDGSRSEFRKALRVGDSIGGSEIAEIQSYQVTLKSEDQEWRLPVGMELRRQGQEEWRLGERSGSSGGSASSGSSRSGSESSSRRDGGSSRSGSSSSEDEEILRRLLERRQEENQ